MIACNSLWVIWHEQLKYFYVSHSLVHHANLVWAIWDLSHSCSISITFCHMADQPPNMTILPALETSCPAGWACTTQCLDRFTCKRRAPLPWSYLHPSGHLWHFYWGSLVLSVQHKAQEVQPWHCHASLPRLATRWCSAAGSTQRLTDWAYHMHDWLGGHQKSQVPMREMGLCKSCLWTPWQDHIEMS